MKSAQKFSGDPPFPFLTSNITACPYCHAKRGEACKGAEGAGTHQIRLERDVMAVCTGGHDDPDDGGADCPLHGDYPFGCDECSVSTDVHGMDRSGESHKDHDGDLTWGED